MNNLSDQQLLRDNAERRSEAAFAELVRRYVDFVYSAARRMVRDAHLAEDVTQGVFVAVARSAGQLTDRPVLSGWLHRTAQNLAANAVQAAPVGLAAGISATATALAGAALQTSTAIAAAKAIAMTMMQKAIIGATLLAAAGTGLYQARQASTWRTQVHTLQQQQAPLADQIGQLTRERDDAKSKQATLQQENEQLRRETVELAKLRGEVAR